MTRTQVARKAISLLALSILFVIGFYLDPVQWWMQDLATGLNSGGPIPTCSGTGCPNP